MHPTGELNALASRPITKEPDIAVTSSSTPTGSAGPLRITLPDATDLDQNEEFCDVELDGEIRRIRFHDYAQIFSIPGMYEQLFATLLQCRSPEVLVGLLGDALTTAGEAPTQLRVLDFGAGNGMVGEELRALGAEVVIGCDLLPEARAAALRDRSGVYAEYLAGDITAPDERRDAVLASAHLNALTCVAALGFDDIPPAAFAAAFNAIGESGWVAFNLRDRYLDNPTDFSRLLERLVDAGLLERVAQTRYRHRLSVSGASLDYIAFVARKHGHIPDDYLQASAG